MGEPRAANDASPRRLALATLLLLAATCALAAVLVPWDALPAGAPVVAPDPAADFSAAERALEDRFHAEIRPWVDAAWVLSVLVPLLVGLTPAGARLVAAVQRRMPRRGGWVLAVLAAVVLITTSVTAVTAAPAAVAEMVLRRYGLSTQTWPSWLADVARGWALSTLVSAVLVLWVVALARRRPRGWPVPAALGAAGLVFLAAYSYPLVVEPLYLRFTPLPESPLRTELLDLARRDGAPVQEVLVADASRRTTATNAYVSGLGGTRRLVVYDTLLDAPPEQVRLVVAHELGHDAADDVLVGTVLGAATAATGVTALAALLALPRLRRTARVHGAGDPRAAALVLALAVAGSELVSPASSLVSRHIERRADVHALNLTQDVDTFVQMQRRLALTNLSDLDPPLWRTVLWRTHPPTPERIALARAWEQHQRAGGDTP